MTAPALAVAAFAPESDAWLDGLLIALEENRRLLAGLRDADGETSR